MVNKVLCDSSRRCIKQNVKEQQTIKTKKQSTATRCNLNDIRFRKNLFIWLVKNKHVEQFDNVVK